MPVPRIFVSSAKPWLLLAWLLVFLLSSGFQWWQERAKQQRQQLQLTEAVQRQMLEKIAQHKAHLTALASLAALKDASGQPAAMRQVARSIALMYPRIEQIELVTTAHTASGDALDQSSGDCRSPAAARTVAPLRPGESDSLPDSAHRGRYLLLKKIAEPAGWLCMRIDSAHLLEADTLPPHTGLRIDLDGQPLLQPQGQTAGPNTYQPIGRFTLQGYGQPLQVQLLTQARPLLGWPRLLLSAALSLLLVWLAALVWKSRQQARRHQQRAQLLANEAQLAHASRVNGMGEMASGIAHELAQPVTALLSQSQAALRAQELGKSELLTSALQANVREARRAGAILDRMRSYISNTPSQAQRLDLAQAVAQTLLLLEGPAREAGVQLLWEPVPADCSVWADPVALEQVLHNLVRNALEALSQSSVAEPAIQIAQQADGRQLSLTVRDNGSGIDAATAQHIFDPFFTTKSGGMGLGLPLCATLMERMGGQLQYLPPASAGPATAWPGACFVLTLPLATTGAAPENPIP
ncbi:sensor histidine kinase [Comamonas sp.]|uniref:sensor histidine kinase n=1 Tax=Comamonas sp. TaxID=34028 RepID=UPI003A92BE86